MASGAGMESMEGALESTFALEPKPKVPAAAALPEEDIAEIVAEALPDTAEEIAAAEPAAEGSAISEPEFEIEVDGQREIVKGKEKIVELLQKATH